MAPLPVLSGLAEIAGRYDGYIIDLWGVVHDGVQAFPGVLDCLASLRAAGKTTCMLSNAPRRVAAVRDKLRSVGVPDDAYDHVMTSGEAAHEALRDRPDAAHAALGDRFIHIGPPRDDDITHGLPLHEVSDPADATFALCTGVDDFSEPLELYTPLLDRCLDAGLPMICPNPDLVVMVGDLRAICAGTMAAYYAERGGAVIYHGKPHRGVYARCRHLLGDLPSARILALGDSLGTDLAGAKAAGIDALLICSGIHADELMTGGRPDPARTAALLEAKGLAAIGLMAEMVW
ncbi:MAG: TIGR01459 family HAD-type hydrolase [Rhodospirillaceae bacterium]|nr:TIGR01459 family HAD-type hydrolase [Rhodospirillaceae bacterium]